MSKKYIPSGYQIINVFTYDDEGTIKIRESEDKTILKEILKNGINKPILLHLNDADGSLGYVISGFATLLNNELYISTPDVYYKLKLVDDEIDVYSVEI